MAASLMPRLFKQREQHASPVHGGKAWPLHSMQSSTQANLKMFMGATGGPCTWEQHTACNPAHIQALYCTWEQHMASKVHTLKE